MSDATPPAVTPLLETVQRLWPDATDVSLRSRGQASGPGAHELLVVPDANRPRMLLPAPGRAANAAMARFSAAISTREVAERRATGLALRLGAARLLPHRIVVSDPGDDHVLALLADVLGEPVTVSIGIGTARANRKPVLGVFGASGRPLAFAKVGDSPVAIGHVTGEATALEQVGAQRWRVVQPPELLALRSWRGMEVLVISALVPRAWRGRGVWPIPDAAADEVADAFRGARAPLAATPMWQRCAEAVAALADAEAHERLSDAITRAEACAGDEPVDTGGFHGDFAPWNLARDAGRVQLWDWERFDTGVPVGLDRLHYAVNTVLRAEGVGVDQVLRGLEHAGGRAGSTARHDRVLELAYLVSLATRYLVAAEHDGGDAVRPRGMAMVATLEQLLDTATAGSAVGGPR